MSESVLLDSSALLAHVFGEPIKVPAARFDGAFISAVNLAEVLTKMIDVGAERAEASADLAALSLTIAPFGRAEAEQAAALRPHTRKLGLSLGDRACLATGLLLKAPILTADSAWKRLPEAVGARVVFIR